MPTSTGPIPASIYSHGAFAIIGYRPDPETTTICGGSIVYNQRAMRLLIESVALAEWYSAPSGLAT